MKKWVAVIGANCSFCSICYHVCPEKAVTFSEETRYSVDPKCCTGCRSCLPNCRSYAITFKESCK